MKSPRWFAFLPLVLLAVACRPTGESADPALPATAATTSWQCRNDVEISCNAEACEASESFTPMDVWVDDAGSMNVCAYSGCWEGIGTVAQSEAFIVFTGHDLTFSTAPDAEDRKEDIVIAIDRADHVAILKAGAFAHPLRCQQKSAD